MTEHPAASPAGDATGPLMPPQLTEQEAQVLEQVLDLAREGRTDEVVELLDAGFPINLQNARGDTLLIVATYQRQANTVRALLEHGANPDIVNSMGQTALSCAVFRNDVPLLDLLLDSGADPEAGAHTALQIAQQFGIAAMIERLQDRGARTAP